MTVKRVAEAFDHFSVAVPISYEDDPKGGSHVLHEAADWNARLHTKKFSDKRVEETQFI
jgi:hypothetical protein